jgi:hypothetical protein
MKKIYFAILLSIQLNTFAQSEHFSVLISEVKGDLNNDQLEDKVVVKQDTINEHSPYQLQLFFAQPTGEYKLIAETTKLIEAQFQNGKNGYLDGTGFSAVTITKGILTVSIELLRGNYEHKFRFQNGNFELIGFSEGNSDGRGKLSTVDFNLTTGIRIEKLINYETDKIISKTKKKILIRPLPKLQDVVPFENDLY